jgi:hypothetical protein
MCVVVYMCAQKDAACSKVDWQAVGGATRRRQLTGSYRGAVPHFALLSIQNKAAYARLHGYTFLLAEELYATDVRTPSTPTSSFLCISLPSFFRREVSRGASCERCLAPWSDARLLCLWMWTF